MEKKITNVEWFMVIGFLAIIDIIQLLLDLIPFADVFFGIMSEVLDVGIAFAWAIYVNVRVGKVDWKKFFTQIAGFFGKEASAGGLPLWCLEGISIFALQKFDEKAAKMGIVGQLASQALHSAASGAQGQGAGVGGLPQGGQNLALAAGGPQPAMAMAGANAPKAVPGLSDNVIDLRSAGEKLKDQAEKQAKSGVAPATWERSGEDKKIASFDVETRARQERLEEEAAHFRQAA